MKPFLILLALMIATGASLGADRYAELKTRLGRVYKEVKVVSVSHTEIRIMHQSGFASVPLSQLPDDLQARYGSPNLAAEAEHQEKAKLASAAVHQKLLEEKQEQLQKDAQRRQELAAAAAAAAAAAPAAPVLSGDTGSISSRPAVPTGRSSHDPARLWERSVRQGTPGYLYNYGYSYGYPGYSVYIPSPTSGQ